MRSLVLLLLLLLLPVLPARAAEGADLLPRVAAEGWTEDSARQFMAWLLADRKVDDGEKAWLAALARAEGPVEVGGATLPAPTGRARELLALYAAPPNMHSLWEGDAAQFQQLVELARINEATWNRVVQFTRSRFEPSWRASSLTNAYGPTVLEVSRCYKLLKTSGEPTLRYGSFLLAESLRSVPKEGEPEVPPFLYDWMVRPYLQNP